MNIFIKFKGFIELIMQLFLIPRLMLFVRIYTRLCSRNYRLLI